VARRKFSLLRPPSIRAVVVFPLLVGALVGCTSGESGVAEERLRALEADRGELLRRYATAQDRIRRTQAAALGEPGTEAAKESFYGELRRFAAAEGPGSAALLDRALRVGADLTRVSTPVITTPDGSTGEVATGEERRAVARELAETERELRPFIDRAMADPTVRVGFEALRDSLVATILRLDPGAGSSLRRMEEVADSIAEVDREIAHARAGG
jgi:hypothetical protein